MLAVVVHVKPSSLALTPPLRTVVLPANFSLALEIPKQVATLVLHCWQVRPARQPRRLLIPFLFSALTPMPLRVFLRPRQEVARRAVARGRATLVLSVPV